MSATIVPTAAAPPGAKRISGSVLVWIGLAAYLGLIKIILDTFLPDAFADPAQAALFGWGPLAVIAALGLAGVWLSQKTGFPDAWDTQIPAIRRTGLPLAVGAALGVVLVALDLATGFAGLIAARHGVAQQYTNFPSMLAVFTAAPIIVEVVYRLFPAPLVLWLISSLTLRGRAQTPAFWVLAVITSLLEPLGQAMDLQVTPGLLPAVLAVLYFGLNLVQAAFWRRYGFLASILVRVGFYLVWHVLYIH